MPHHHSLFMHPLFHIALTEVNRSSKQSFGEYQQLPLHPFCSVWTSFFPECELVLPVLCDMVVVECLLRQEKARLKHDLCVPWDKDRRKNETLQISYQPPSGWGLTLSNALCKIPPTTNCNTQMFTYKGRNLGKGHGLASFWWKKQDLCAAWEEVLTALPEFEFLIRLCWTLQYSCFCLDLSSPSIVHLTALYILHVYMSCPNILQRSADICCTCRVQSS